MVRTTQVGNSVALGTVQWGQSYGIANRTGQPSLDEIKNILASAREAGIQVLDTARAYGTAEETIAALIGRDPYWTVVTKLDPGVWTQGQSDKRTLALTESSVERSLGALGRNRLHTLLLHRPQHQTVAGGLIWKRLLRYRDEQKIKKLGISVLDPAQAWALLDDPDVDAIQVPASLLDRRLAGKGFFEKAKERHKNVYVRSIFLQGLPFLEPNRLTGNLSVFEAALHSIRTWSNARGLFPSAAFLTYACQLPGATILLGCETATQLRTNLEHIQTEHSMREELSELQGSLPKIPEWALNPRNWKAVAEASEVQGHLQASELLQD